MKMKKRKLIKKVKDLEKRIEALESRPYIMPDPNGWSIPWTTPQWPVTCGETVTGHPSGVTTYPNGTEVTFTSKPPDTDIVSDK